MGCKAFGNKARQKLLACLNERPASSSKQHEASPAQQQCALMELPDRHARTGSFNGTQLAVCNSSSQDTLDFEVIWVGKANGVHYTGRSCSLIGPQDYIDLT